MTRSRCSPLNGQGANVHTYLPGKVHDSVVLTRRVGVLAGHLAGLLPPRARVLDIGCGDGLLARRVTEMRSDVSIEGIDVLVQPDAGIAVKPFDGSTIPFLSASFDAAMLIDVLHHTVDPLVLLKEAGRVARVIVIKDHLREGFLADATLRFMDWIGNAHHGVALPYNYWSGDQWNEAFDALGLVPSTRITSLGLYPAPASWLFERTLHFVAKLERPNV
jgi:SAM-dependent methyltransferase